MKKGVFYIVVLVCFVIMAIASLNRCNSPYLQDKEVIRIDTVFKSDTIVLYDTIRIKDPIHHYTEVVRYDTIRVNDIVSIEIPIEQKEYKHEAYRAVIEGYKPKLLSMEVYNKNTYIRDTIQITKDITRNKQPKFAISAGVGYGLTPRGFEPSLNVTFGYILFSK